MLLLSQTPATKTFSPFPNPNPNNSLFSKTKSTFPSSYPTNAPRRRTPLSLATNAADQPSPSSSSPYQNPEDTVFAGDDGVPLEGVIQFDKPRGAPSPLKAWGKVALLAGGDLLFLLVFSAFGRLSHGLEVFDVETFRTADPFLAGWFLSAYFLGGYNEDGRGENGEKTAILAASKSWAVGIPLGIAIRALTLGRIPAPSFMLVTMGSTAVLLIGWRAALHSLLPSAQTKGNDVYRRGNPFELFELLTSLIRRW